jgi:hypothetical protein
MSNGSRIEDEATAGALRAGVLGSPAEMRVETPIRIDPLSVTSLYLKLRVRGHDIGTATGFLVSHRERYFLISNWHVFAGRDAETGELLSKETGAMPDEVRIAHHQARKLGAWRFTGESLMNDDGSPRWVAHPGGSEIDVAALELQKLKSWAAYFPFDLNLANVDVEPYPGMPVCIIGFPLGLRENVFFPIWKTGHIASDPDMPHKGHLPAFLIDATTRRGMSGSPVVVRTTGSYLTKSGHVVTGRSRTRFLGVYSGRVHKESEIGRVWRPNVVHEVLAQAVGV